MVALVVVQKIDDVLIGRDIGPVFKELLLLNLGECKRMQRWVTRTEEKEERLREKEICDTVEVVKHNVKLPTILCWKK